MMNGYKGLTEITAKKIEMLGLNEIKEKKTQISWHKQRIFCVLFEGV